MTTCQRCFVVVFAFAFLVSSARAQERIASPQESALYVIRLAEQRPLFPVKATAEQQATLDQIIEALRGQKLEAALELWGRVSVDLFAGERATLVRPAVDALIYRARAKTIHAAATSLQPLMTEKVMEQIVEEQKPAFDEATVNLNAAVALMTEYSRRQRYTVVVRPVINNVRVSEHSNQYGNYRTYQILGDNLQTATEVRMGSLSFTPQLCPTCTEPQISVVFGPGQTPAGGWPALGALSVITPGGQATYIAAPTITNVRVTEHSNQYGRYRTYQILGSNLQTAVEIKLGTASFPAELCTSCTEPQVLLTFHPGTPAGGYMQFGPLSVRTLGGQVSYSATPAINEVRVTEHSNQYGRFRTYQILGDNLQTAVEVKFGTSSYEAELCTTCTEKQILRTFNPGTPAGGYMPLGTLSVRTLGGQTTYSATPLIREVRVSENSNQYGTFRTYQILGDNLQTALEVKFGTLSYEAELCTTCTERQILKTFSPSQTPAGGWGALGPLTIRTAGGQVTYASAPVISEVRKTDNSNQYGQFRTFQILGTNASTTIDVTMDGVTFVPQLCTTCSEPHVSVTLWNNNPHYARFTQPGTFTIISRGIGGTSAAFTASR